MLLAAQAIRVLGQVATLVVLARLLPPSAFGLLAMVASLGRDARPGQGVRPFGRDHPEAGHHPRPGFGAVLDQRRRRRGCLGAGCSCARTAAGAVLRPARARGRDASGWRWASSLSGLTVQHWALLRRQMRFGAIAGLETAADLASFAAAIAPRRWRARATGRWWRSAWSRRSLLLVGQLDGLPLATGAAGAGGRSARAAALRRLGDGERACPGAWRAASTRS